MFPSWLFSFLFGWCWSVSGGDEQETRSHCAAQAGLELMLVLFLPALEYWDDRHASPDLDFFSELNLPSDFRALSEQTKHTSFKKLLPSPRFH